MILTLLSIFILITGVLIAYLIDKGLIHCNVFGYVAVLFLVFGGVMVVVCIGVICTKNIGVQNKIKIADMTYESLCKRYEIIQSEYEDVSKTEVLKDINEWNIEVQREKYWAENIWTNWMQSQKYADSLKFVETEGA